MVTSKPAIRALGIPSSDLRPFVARNPNTSKSMKLIKTHRTHHDSPRWLIVFSPKIRHLFAEGSGFHLIDHPGERRTINRINFNYKSISRREGKGLVKVLAG
jgi:hypothetical protein